MQTLEESEASIAFAIEILKLGGVVAHATETCYGLACDMTNSDAVEKLFNIKNRPPDQPVSALFSSIKASSEWALWSKEALELAKKELPGPLTIILPMKQDKTLFPIPHPKPNPTLGIRVSPHQVAMSLAKEFGKPLSTTSANLTGQPSTYSVEEIEKQLVENPPDLVIDSGPLENKSPSKVVMFINGEVTVVRE
ncbi:MAG: L-threonylcarbamoyladenylate synthase [Candidatus Peribacteraceae bacterium]|jgi:L-threonylcarbamoyladenylate synthase|nr:L-threonylcarbamoyladenylate synthase [Candidatus Peribacteraceae bacterium]HCI04077.1 threonylcarbamoyl-AMP synthase [Candidatus Peribacteria bacterium]|tara:strand:- start:2215 stop:2799 length:585 start_codon:yes stop_codon:yes gene_type:complete